MGIDFIYNKNKDIIAVIVDKLFFKKELLLIDFIVNEEYFALTKASQFKMKLKNIGVFENKDKNINIRYFEFKNKYLNKVYDFIDDYYSAAEIMAKGNLNEYIKEFSKTIKMIFSDCDFDKLKVEE